MTNGEICKVADKAAELRRNGGFRCVMSLYIVRALELLEFEVNEDRVSCVARELGRRGGNKTAKLRREGNLPLKPKMISEPVSEDQFERHLFSGIKVYRH